MRKMLRKIIAVGVSLVMFSASFTVRCWADGTTATGTAVTTDVTTPATTDTTVATSVATPTTTNTTATEWRQPCVDGLFQPSDSVNPETSFYGYSLNPFDYYSVTEWEQMAFGGGLADSLSSNSSFVGWNDSNDCKAKLKQSNSHLAGCLLSYRHYSKPTFQGYRKNGKKFDAFLTLEDAYSKKKLKRMKKYLHYKSIKELVEHESVQVDEADYNKRFEIDKKKALKVGDYIQIESYLETLRYFTCYIPINVEKGKEISDAQKKLYPKNKYYDGSYDYSLFCEKNNFHFSVVPESYFWEGAPAYLILGCFNTINSKDRSDWCRYAKMKYYIGQMYSFKDPGEKYDQIQTVNMNSSGYFNSFFYYFKVKKQLDSHGNLKAKVILKRPILWRRCGSLDDRYWLDSSPYGHIDMDCLDFVTKTCIDSCMPNFTTKMVGLTKEEWKHLTTYRGAAVVYWKNGIPKKYLKIGNDSKFIREKDYLIKVKNPPFSD